MAYGREVGLHGEPSRLESILRDITIKVLYPSDILPTILRIAQQAFPTSQRYVALSDEEIERCFEFFQQHKPERNPGLHSKWRRDRQTNVISSTFKTLAQLCLIFMDPGQGMGTFYKSERVSAFSKYVRGHRSELPPFTGKPDENDIAAIIPSLIRAIAKEFIFPAEIVRGLNSRKTEASASTTVSAADVRNVTLGFGSQPRKLKAAELASIEKVTISNTTLASAISMAQMALTTLSKLTSTVRTYGNQTNNEFIDLITRIKTTAEALQKQVSIFSPEPRASYLQRRGPEPERDVEVSKVTLQQLEADKESLQAKFNEGSPAVDGELRAYCLNIIDRLGKLQRQAHQHASQP